MTMVNLHVQELPSTNKSYTKGQKKELWLIGTDHLTNRCSEKVLGSQLHRYVCAQTTRLLLLFKFLLRVLVTERTEEAAVLWYCKRKDKVKLPVDV